MNKTISKFHLPYLGFGLGLRPPHYNDILAGKSRASWFEVISENFMSPIGQAKGSPSLRKLELIREKFPIILHGVSMSLGGYKTLDKDYLKRLKELARIIQPAWMSDHLCWTGVHNRNLHDLLPLPYTEETLRHVVSRIKEAQDFLERPLIIENVSSYVEFEASEMKEYEFVSRIAKEADCGLLFDVNNIYVSAFNHGNDPVKYLNALPQDRVVQIHLAGPSPKGSLLIDTHDSPVRQEVWELYRLAIQRFGPLNTMIEWDANIPPLTELENELDKARQISESVIDKFAYRKRETHEKTL